MKMRLDWFDDIEKQQQIEPNQTPNLRSDEMSAYFRFNEKIKNFQIKASLSLFSYLFDPLNENKTDVDVDEDMTKRESYRLWGHFCSRCDSKLDKFVTYLTQEQINNLYYNLDSNQELLNYSKGW